MDFEPSLSSHFIIYIRDYLLDQGLSLSMLDDFEAVLNDINDNTQVPLSTIATLFEEAVEITGNVNLGLDIGSKFHYESAGMVVLLMLAAPSVEDGVKALVHYDRLFDSAIEIDLDVSPKLTKFSISLINPKGLVVDQIHEYLLVFLVQALSTATRKKVPLKEVWFQHALNKDAKALSDYFGCKPKFSQPCSRLVFDSSYMKEKFYTSNATLYNLCTQMFKGYSLSNGMGSNFLDVMCREIMSQSKVGSPTLDSVAKSMAISGRTLRRRLAEQNYTFLEIKNLAREKQARYFLEHTNLSMSEIAFELGFSELSAFSRAFRHWTGKAPQSFRL